jgi:hypothetical protein
MEEIRTLAEIGTAIGTVGTVIIALLFRFWDARRKQAEHISAWMEFLPAGEDTIDDQMAVKLILLNASGQLVYNLIATIVSAQTGSGGGAYRNYIGRLPPGRTEHKIPHPGQGMHRRHAIELVFEDAGGRTWVRPAKGMLARIHKDPLAFYGIDPPVSWWMP